MPSWANLKENGRSIKVRGMDVTLRSFMVAAILMSIHYLFKAIKGVEDANIEVQGLNLAKLANYSITVGPILDIYIKSQGLDPTLANMVMVLFVSLVIYLTYKQLSTKEILIKDMEIHDVKARLESTLKQKNGITLLL